MVISKKKRIRKASAMKSGTGFNVVCPHKVCGYLNTFPESKKDDIVACINCRKEIRITKVI